ncbi:hypothetical protein V9T40_010628 [Parthenolecanium corni]|uniref:Uncharacterized protein n=1 Tax=Parthenolecanium corni TaxID=536013 RepID=A0AAN9T3W2_9HEMI
MRQCDIEHSTDYGAYVMLAISTRRARLSFKYNSIVAAIDEGTCRYECLDCRVAKRLDYTLAGEHQSAFLNSKFQVRTKTRTGRDETRDSSGELDVVGIRRRDPQSAFGIIRRSSFEFRFAILFFIFHFQFAFGSVSAAVASQSHQSVSQSSQSQSHASFSCEFSAIAAVGPSTRTSYTVSTTYIGAYLISSDPSFCEFEINLLLVASSLSSSFLVVFQEVDRAASPGRRGFGSVIVIYVPSRPVAS